MKNKFPYYLFLLPVFYLLHNYNELFGFISINLPASFLLKVSIFTGLVFLVAYPFLKSVSKTSILVFFVMLFVLYFGPWHDFIKFITPGHFISSYKIVIPLSLILIFIISRYFIYRPGILQKFSTFLSILLALVCITELSFSAIKLSQYTKDKNLFAPGKPVCDSYTSCIKADSLKPDIYFLVLDEYTSNQTLMDVWQFDNSAITGYLAEKGFYTLESSTSNYNFTPYAISAMLNMNYPDKRKSSAALTSFLVSQSVKSVSDNETFCLLKKENYSIRFFSPLQSTIEDIGLVKEFGNYPQKQLYSHTLPGRISKDIGWNFYPRLEFLDKWEITGNDISYNLFNKRAEDVLKTIEYIKSTTNTSKNRQPKFILGHLLITHPPHLFDSTGGQRNIKDILKVKWKDSYIQQIKYANKVIKDLTDHILANNKKNTIILITGDHGFRNMNYSNHKYYFSTFCSFYFPDRDYSSLYMNMSGVNIFRTVFNHSFCQQLPMLKDSSVLVTFRNGQFIQPR